MKRVLILSAALFALPAVAGPADGPVIANNCAANVLLFADQILNNTAAAQQACQTLVQQVGAKANECAVQNANGGKKRARLRVNRRAQGNNNVGQQLFQTILQDLLNQGLNGLANGVGLQISQANNTQCQ